MIASCEGSGSNDPTEMGTGSNAGPHFVFGGNSGQMVCKAQMICNTSQDGAGYRIRTRGPLITNQVLYQLS